MKNLNTPEGAKQPEKILLLTNPQSFYHAVYVIIEGKSTLAL